MFQYRIFHSRDALCKGILSYLYINCFKQLNDSFIVKDAIKVKSDDFIFAVLNIWSRDGTYPYRRMKNERVYGLTPKLRIIPDTACPV